MFVYRLQLLSPTKPTTNNIEEIRYLLSTRVLFANVNNKHAEQICFK